LNVIVSAAGEGAEGEGVALSVRAQPQPGPRSADTTAVSQSARRAVTAARG